MTIENEHVAADLGSVIEHLDGAEVVLDFSAVRRIDAEALKTLESLAGAAASKGVTLVLKGVQVEVYRVLMLAKLTPRFAFVN